MEKGYLSTVITLLLTLSLVQNSTSQCTVYQFVAQPPTTFNCNPFSDDSTPRWRLRVQCIAERRSGSDSQFEIHWIHRDKNGAIEDLGMPGFSTYNENVQRATSVFGNQYINVNEGFNEGMLGQYWCEVYHNGSPTGAHSDGFTILRPEEYSQQTQCSGIIHELVELCQDEPPPPVPIKTSTAIRPLQSTTSSTIPFQVTTSTVKLEQLITFTSSLVKESVFISVTNSPNEPTLQNRSIQASSSKSLVIRLTTVVASTLVPTPTSIPVGRTSFLHSNFTSVPRGTVMSTLQQTAQSYSQVSFRKTTSNLIDALHSSRTKETVFNTNKLATASTRSSTTAAHENTASSVLLSSCFTSVLVPPFSIPEEQIDNEMDFLLLTAILLIIFLTIIIILLLVIACLMRCGWKPRTQRTDDRMHNHFNRMSSARSSEIQLLKRDDLNFEEALQTPYSLATEITHPSTNHHRYSTIDDSFMVSSKNNSSTSHTDLLKMPPLKPPSIIKSKSPTLTNSIHLLSGVPSSLETSFQYSRLGDENKDSSDPHKSSECITAPLEGSGEGVVCDIPNESLDNDLEYHDKTKPAPRRADRDDNGPVPTYSYITTDIHKPEKLNKTKNGQGQLENWDYQWNPMYMKVPVGLRIINTL